MNYPKVSIMIPTYNRAKFLVEAIDSALAQDYPDIEVIVSDNASSDNTSEIVKPYLSDKRFRYFRNDENIGLEANWKKLLYEYATGNFGKLLNDDDYLIDNTHISKAVAIMLDNSIDIVFSGSLIRWENPNDDKSSNKEIVFELPEIVSRDWWIKNLGNPQGKLTLFPNLVGGAVFNLERARELSAFYPPCYGLDYELAFKFILSGDTGYLRGYHWTERYHDSDAKTSDLERILEGIKLFKRVYDHGISIGLPQKNILEFAKRSQAVFIRNFLIPKWFIENGCSCRSILLLDRTVRKNSLGVSRQVFISVSTISEILKNKNKKLYSVARKIYSKFKYQG